MGTPLLGRDPDGQVRARGSRSSCETTGSVAGADFAAFALRPPIVELRQQLLRIALLIAQAFALGPTNFAPNGTMEIAENASRLGRKSMRAKGIGHFDQTKLKFRARSGAAELRSNAIAPDRGFPHSEQKTIELFRTLDQRLAVIGKRQ